MKLLFLANRTPFPPYRGDKLKIYNLAKRLSEKHELYLLTFAETPEDLTWKAELEKTFKEVHFVYLPKWRASLNCLAAAWDPLPLQVIYFQSGAMRKALAKLLHQQEFDAVHVQHLRMSPYLAKQRDVPRILDLPDAFSLYWERRKAIPRNIFRKAFEFFEQRRLLRYEPVMKQYDLSLACSTEDIAYLQETHGVTNLQLLPNGVDLDTFSGKVHDYSHHKTLLFTGNMDYAPNIDAVVYFVRDILPLVRAKFPEIMFIIAGQRPVPDVLALADGQVVVTGFIEDLSEVYNSASVVVAPLRFGAGTQNKVLEAMAMGVPVVCSNIGFKGLGIENGEGAFMETAAVAFADRILQLLADADLREQTGQKGAAIIRERFSWDKIATQLEAYFKQIIRK